MAGRPRYTFADMRIAVIGAGFVGVHVAVELARRGAAVTLIDRDDPGQGTTAGSFAWIDASHPGIAPYLELRLLGLEGWHRRRAELGHPSWLSLTGTTIWTRDPEVAVSLARHVRRLELHGARPERLSPAAAREHEPDLVVPAGIDVVYRFPREGWVHTRLAIAALLAQGRAVGLQLRASTEVSGPSLEASGEVTGVVLASGETVRADAVVSCVGRWTQSLLGPAGVDVPMLDPCDPSAQVAGLVVRTTQLGHRIGGVILADGLLMRPAGDGRLLLHSDEIDRGLTEDQAPPGLAEDLLGRLAPRVRGAERARIEQARVCVRAIPADRIPVVGWARDGLYVVATHSGITLAPALGELVASELIDGRPRDELARFRPTRFESVSA